MKKRTKLDQKRKFINKSSLKSIELMNEFNNIIRGATSNEEQHIIRGATSINNNIEHRKKNNYNIEFESAFDNENINTILYYLNIRKEFRKNFNKLLILQILRIFSIEITNFFIL